jgi:hypothetical protein
MYRWFGMVPQGLFEFFPIFLFGDFRSRFLGDLLWDVCMNPSWEKGLDFGVFIVLGFGVFLAEILWFLLIQRVLVDHNLAMECPWGVPTIPKVLFGSAEQIGRSGFGFGGVDPRVLFISSCLGYTGPTDALDRSDRCEPFMGFASGELLNPCIFGLCWCWSILGSFGGVLVVFWGCFCSRA